jgi:hypothetical protein
MANLDKCTRGFVGLTALCVLQPKNKMSQCLKEASQYNEICSKKVSGVSAGDASAAFGGRDAQPYKKADGRVYINHAGEVPFNGRHWNGKCYAIYKNGDLRYFEDSNGNACDNEGVLHGHDN